MKSYRDKKEVLKSNRFYDTAIRGLRAVLALVAKVKVTGLENIPGRGGVIIVANHVSHIDPLIMGAYLRKSGRRTRALAKSSLFEIPYVGGALFKMGHIPVFRATERATDALRAAIREIKAGEVVGLYPEGTVPKDGSRLGVFKTGAARIALATGRPVVPVAQLGAQRIVPAIKKGLPKHIAKSLVRRRPVTILVGKPIYPGELFAVPDPENREQVAQVNAILRAEIDKLLSLIEK